MSLTIIDSLERKIRDILRWAHGAFGWRGLDLEFRRTFADYEEVRQNMWASLSDLYVWIRHLYRHALRKTYTLPRIPNVTGPGTEFGSPPR